jgi:hypothetical protein
VAERPDQRERAEAEPEDPALAIAARHALHDEELIVAFAVDAAAEESPRARALIERCQACSTLHADLVALGGALRAIPSASSIAAAGTKPAPRDFRLSVQTANRLRPGSVVLRLGDRIREAIASFGRPVGMSLASLGVVGLLLSTLTFGATGDIGGAPEDASNLGAAGSSAAPGATSEVLEATVIPGDVTGAGATPGQSSRTSFETRSTASPAPLPRDTTQGTISSQGPSTSLLIVAGSIVLLVGGLALVGAARGREPIPGR